MFTKRAVANAPQISAVPLCTLVRFTRLQLSPPPLTLFTTVFEPDFQSVAIYARSNSLVEAVEKGGALTDLLEDVEFFDTFASIASDPHACAHDTKIKTAMSAGRISTTLREVIREWLASEWRTTLL